MPSTKCTISKLGTEKDIDKQFQRCFEHEFPGVIAVINSLGLSVERNLQTIDYNYALSVKRLRDELVSLRNPKRKPKKGDSIRVDFLEKLADLVENAAERTKEMGDRCSESMMGEYNELREKAKLLLLDLAVADWEKED